MLEETMYGYVKRGEGRGTFFVFGCHDGIQVALDYLLGLGVSLEYEKRGIP